MKKIWFLFCLICLSSNILLAQNKMTGTVTDVARSPLPGVSVINMNTQKGTQTGMDGKYSIDVVEGEVLQFSLIGMDTEEIKVSELNGGD